MMNFDDIRPYHDEEVRGVVDMLLNDEELVQVMAQFRLPGLYRRFPGLAKWLAGFGLRHEARNVDTIAKVQVIIEKYLDKLIEATTNGLTSSGLDELPADRAYLFISNHRDITLDPALVNYMLYHSKFDTLQIAIGDNLLKRPYLTHLMKLNKSFIVKRSVEGREKLRASKQLSAYIHYCVREGQNVWIAQREGRAKDGIDKTESAIITMLHLADREHNVSLKESLSSLNIVPVSISYELDPCDEMKARELHAIDTHGRFEKDEDSDVMSILHGMVGEKGQVHVAFGKPLELRDLITTEGVAELIDHQILEHYRLHIINYLAMEQIQPDYMDYSRIASIFGVSQDEVEKKRQQFRQRLAAMDAELKPYILQMYANPLIRKNESQYITPAAT